jgi:hypothetical protein
VLALLKALVAGGGALAATGVAALGLAQPRHVWYPLLLIGGAGALLGSLMLPAMRRRYAADELRRMAARDA